MSDDRDTLLRRIRILKTGLYNVGANISIKTPEEIQYFEKLATPGTELKLERVYDKPESPWLIKVLAPDGQKLGYRIST